MKSTQNGISEYLLCRSIAHAIEGKRVFYVLPTFELVKRFVDERYTKCILNTSYYKGLVKLAKEEEGVRPTESVRSKDIGNGNISFVASFSKVGFTEYAADEVIIDELDKCDQDNVEMAWERLSASEYRRQTKISNPTFRNIGIDREYALTDKREWNVYCQAGHRVQLDWFKHIVRKTDNERYIIRDSEWTWNSQRDIYPICDICGKPVDRKGKGIWVPTAESRKRGYRLTKLCTGTVTLVEILDRFMSGLQNSEIMQRFYNADLGQAYTAEGSGISRDMILNCVGEYYSGKEDGVIIAGIDVGTYYNFVIKKMLPDGTMKTLLVGKERNTDRLIEKLKEYKIRAGVIDGLPETREAKKISNAFNFMFLCYFGSVKNDKIDIINKTVTVQRTSAIDAVKAGLLTKKIKYPMNIESDAEFIDQMTSSVRVYEDTKRTGTQGKYTWVEGNKADHYLLATAYCLVARRLIVLISGKSG